MSITSVAGITSADYKCRQSSLGQLQLGSQAQPSDSQGEACWLAKMTETDIPFSTSTVDVYVIDTTTYLTDVAGELILNPVYPGYEKFTIPSYSFLIHNKTKNSRVLYDLGLRKNWKTHLSPQLLEEIQRPGYGIEVTEDVASILERNEVQLESLDSIILSHHHWDHVGDVSTFPLETHLFVGPSYTEEHLPGWPSDPHQIESTADTYSGRSVTELHFAPSSTGYCRIGGFDAFDFFEDGSFYILKAPGHTASHLCALARTTSESHNSTFMFLAGDITHHCSTFRPSNSLPLSVEAPSGSLENAKLNGSHEDYRMWHWESTRDSNTQISRTSPFCVSPRSVDKDPELARKTLDKLLPLDAAGNIFTVCAHDDALLDIIDFFPKRATNWKERGWKDRCHWKFLKPLQT